MITLKLTLDQYEAVLAALVSESLNQISRTDSLRNKLKEEEDYLRSIDNAYDAVKASVDFEG